MTRDDIIKLAREACDTDKVDAWHNGFWTVTQEELERFAALVAAAERERVMQVVQSMKADLEAKFEKTYLDGVVAGAAAEREACALEADAEASIEGIAQRIAAAIRARGD